MTRLAEDSVSMTIYTTSHSPSGDQQIDFVPNVKDETGHIQNNVRRRNNKGYETVSTRCFLIAEMTAL